MTQRKISTFFNASLGGNSNYRSMAMKSSGPLYQNNLGSAAKPIQWTSQMYRPNPVLQRYHRSREILTEIKDCVMKPTTKSCDMWSQYSPQCNNFHTKSTVQRATDYSSVNLPKMTRCRKFPKFSSPVATVSPFRHTVGFYRQQPANKLYPSSSVNRSPLSNCNRQSNVSDRYDAVFVGTQSNRQIHEDMNRIGKDNNDDSVDALVNSLFGDEEENIHARPKKPPKRKNLRKNPSMNCESSVVDVLEISRDSQKENLPVEDDTDEV
ncbi:unnamed protein product [Clavelina lepadiformis]|uniref:Uncharacterized protein n=1 Tax=Clavelina lepadiformis TaxID=159417 RepID=A0ABP0FT53_CLALP